MQLSPKAEAILSAMARQQGLKTLSFDADGLIPILLDGRLQIAIGYSPANDALFLFGVVDPKPDPDALDPWSIFARNVPLAERRTRLALDPSAGALVLVCDVYVEGLEYWRFSEIMDRFVEDLRLMLQADDGQRPVPAALPEAPADVLIFRP